MGAKLKVKGNRVTIIRYKRIPRKLKKKLKKRVFSIGFGESVLIKYNSEKRRWNLINENR